MRLRFTLRQLEYLVAVGEAGSIAEAAEKLNVSSPSISAAISQLESEFGVKLFVRRHAHGLALTSGGRQFLLQARDLLAAADRLNGLAMDLSEAVRGPLAVGCLLTFAQLVFPELRRRFEQQYQEVRMRQTEAHHGALMDMLRRGELDAALSYDLNMADDLDFESFAELPPYALLPPSHRLAGHAEITLAELAGEAMVLLDLPHSSDYFLQLLRDAGVTPHIAERTRDMATLRSMVANGFGFALANIRSRSDVAPDGKPLRFVPLAGGVRPLHVGLFTIKAANKPRVVRAFSDHCRELISSKSIPGLAPSPEFA